MKLIKSGIVREFQHQLYVIEDGFSQLTEVQKLVKPNTKPLNCGTLDNHSIPEIVPDM